MQETIDFWYSFYDKIHSPPYCNTDRNIYSFKIGINYVCAQYFKVRLYLSKYFWFVLGRCKQDVQNRTELCLSRYNFEYKILLAVSWKIKQKYFYAQRTKIIKRIDAINSMIDLRIIENVSRNFITFVFSLSHSSVNNV